MNARRISANIDGKVSSSNDNTTAALDDDEEQLKNNSCTVPLLLAHAPALVCLHCKLKFCCPSA